MSAFNHTVTRRLAHPLPCLALAAVLALGLPGAVSAQEAAAPDIGAGIAAFEQGEFQQAANIFGGLAEAGDAEGMFYLGRMLEVGAGLPRPNPAAALAQYQAAAEAGSLRAHNRIGLLYVSGSGVLQDFALAAEHLKTAADGGLADAQYNYGAMFQNGLGMEADQAQALALYGQAAAQGHLASNAILGEAYFNGDGVERDLAQAFTHHEAAAVRGAPFSQYRLGQFLAAGEVTARDAVQAHMYLNLAAAAGVAEAGPERDALGGEMPAAEVMQAQQLAREWTPAE